MVKTILRRFWKSADPAPAAPAGSSDPEPPPAQSPKRLFSAVLRDYWQAQWSGLTTSKQIESILRHHLYPDAANGGLGSYRVEEITQLVAFAWHRSKRDKSRIANRALFCARQAWRDLLPDRVNPFERVKPFPERPRTRRFTDDERERFRVALGQERNEGGVTEVVADALWVIRCTASRKGEILGVRRDQIDLSAEIAVLDEHKTDDEEGARVIHLGACMDVIRRRCQICDETGERYLFPSDRSASGHVEAIGEAFHRVCRRAGIVRTRDLVPYMLRGDWATKAIDEGEDIRVVQKILGHKDLATTQRYARPGTQKARAAALHVGQTMGVTPW